MKRTNIILSVLLAGAMAYVGCGGGGGSSSGTPNSAPISSKGVITAFGSVFVNGIEFDTTGTTITKDGVSASESDLRIGLVVTVNGT